jgi:hypothetical protein
VSVAVELTCKWSVIGADRRPFRASKVYIFKEKILAVKLYLFKVFSRAYERVLAENAGTVFISLVCFGKLLVGRIIAI